jgi:hypothetical protein
VLGCSFTIQGENNENGVDYGLPGRGCTTALQLWRGVAAQFHPQVVLVELGLWDEMNWLQDGQVRHLGQPVFDRELRGRMDLLVKTLGSGHVPVVFLTVPWVQLPAAPNGSAPVQSSALRHTEINAMLQSVARSLPGKAYYFDMSPYVTPGDRFDSVVDGELCRMTDGVHFALGPVSSPRHVTQTRCMADLQAVLYPWLRRLVGAHGR